MKKIDEYIMCSSVMVGDAESGAGDVNRQCSNCFIVTLFYCFVDGNRDATTTSPNIYQNVFLICCFFDFFYHFLNHHFRLGAGDEGVAVNVKIQVEKFFVVSDSGD